MIPFDRFEIFTSVCAYIIPLSSSVERLYGINANSQAMAKPMSTVIKENVDVDNGLPAPINLSARLRESGFDLGDGIAATATNSSAGLTRGRIGLLVQCIIEL